jgi:hypothetical protein
MCSKVGFVALGQNTMSSTLWRKRMRVLMVSAVALFFISFCSCGVQTEQERNAIKKVSIEKSESNQCKVIKTEKGLALLLESVGVKDIEKEYKITKIVNEIAKSNNSNTESRVYGATEPSSSFSWESVKPAKVVKGATLVGKLHLGTNIKAKGNPSMLVIGKTYVYFCHYLDRDKYNNKTVLVKADIHGPEQGREFSGATIVNVQQIKIIKTP